MKQYVRVKVKDGEITQSQLIELDKLNEWLNSNPVKSYLLAGVNISFSIAKKSSTIKLS